ncbi:MAG: Smr/MutS family protein [Alphaproteobacteria bacterium]|nr:Smr/MutS family protein [Alphaproteobacteria bacterium]
MKQLTDKDIANMAGVDFVPDAAGAADVRRELHLSRRIPQITPAAEHIVLDFHQHTEEEAWDMIMAAAQSGARSATVITGASGILKIKFQNWVADSLISRYIVQCVPLNNGSFSVKFKKQN